MPLYDGIDETSTHAGVETATVGIVVGLLEEVGLPLFWVLGEGRGGGGCLEAVRANWGTVAGSRLVALLESQ